MGGHWHRNRKGLRTAGELKLLPTIILPLLVTPCERSTDCNKKSLAQSMASTHSFVNSKSCGRPSEMVMPKEVAYMATQS
eukprot:scaffold180541_cov15-Tisochrysis_lutea.AAC.1